MDRGGRSTLSSLQRVQEFLTQHPLCYVPTDLGNQATELADVIVRLSSEAVDQETGHRFVRVHAESQRALRATLHKEHLQPLARVAREVFGVSGMDKAFRLPRTGTATQALLVTAAAMADAAAKETQAFVRHGLPQDFIERLKAAATALDEARTATTVSARRRVTATASVKDQLKRGRKAVRLLDAILAPRLAKDPALLAAWRSAKHVRPTTAAVASSEETSLKVA